MVIVPDRLIGTAVEVGRVSVTQGMLHGYAQRCGDSDAGDFATAPVSFALTLLSLRRRESEDVRIAAGAFAVHGGHEIEQLEPIRSGNTYVVWSSITEVFEKSGRSGLLTIIARRSDIDDLAADARVASITEQQVVRWAQARPQRSRPPRQSLREVPTVVFTGEPAVGDELSRTVRRCPARPGITSWAEHLQEREPLFSNLSEARDRGFADLVVPGPMLSAFAAQMLAQALPAWRTRRLSMTFRQSVLAEESILLSAVATERDDCGTLACDIVIEDAAGETCAIGAALLHQR